MVPLSVKITSVQKQMLVELSKKWKMKIDDLIAELIEGTYAAKPKRKK